ncbi:ketosteroid isomerase-like protein [Pedobacter sp. CAN_A7]|uniref:YybH family protein n=1 Tax=Pedobacter sp. CAN_A7 TaxID=2787722 RepID=UPI0018CB344E
MSTQIEKSTVEQLISSYAEAVNKGNRQAISAFYTQDGLLIPEGFKPVPQGNSNDKYFANTGVQIGFTVKEVIVEGNYAFVEAQANTKLTDLKNNQELKRKTRDLFILRNTDGDWKIFRYIFNSKNKA